MFILDNPSFLLPLGIIIPNAFSIIFLGVFIFSGFLRTFSPQNVKNIVTFLPIVAAPLAIINDAIALSKSPLNTTIVWPFLLGTVVQVLEISVPDRIWSEHFIIVASIIPLFLSKFISLLLVFLVHASISLQNPSSDTFTFKTSPSLISSIVAFTCIKGPGQDNPVAFNSLTLSAATSFITESPFSLLFILLLLLSKTFAL